MGVISNAMGSAPRPLLQRSRIALLMLAALLILAAALRLPALKYPYEHIDEEIGVTVASHVVSRPTLDTNWDHMANEAWWTTPQFNFSAYNLTAAAVLGIAGGGEAPDPLEAKRLLRWFSALLGIASVGLTFVLGRRMFGETVGLIASALVAVNPLLIQDSLYVRAETFVTALMLVYLLLLESQRAQRWPTLLMAAVVGGVMVATKISLLAVVPILFLPWWPAQDGDVRTLQGYIALGLRELPRRLPVVVLGLSLGFVAGAPYALVDFKDYLAGLSALNEQYTTGNWPNGLIEGSLGQRLGYALQFFAATAGAPMLVAAFLGAVWVAVNRRFRLFFIFSCAVVIAVRFGSYPVFFERNFSHIVPIFLVFAAFLAVQIIDRVRSGPAVKAAALAGLVLLLAAPAARTSARLVWVSAPGADHLRLQIARLRLSQAYHLPNTSLYWDRDLENLERRLANPCQELLIDVPFIDDVFGARALARLRSSHTLTEIERFTTTFDGVPPSTLHVYFTPPSLFLLRPADKAKCAASPLYAAREAAGDMLTVLRREADPAWTLGGSFGAVAPPFPDDSYFASWSGDDRNTGRMRMEIQTAEASSIILPYLTGPVTGRQSITVTDAADGSTIQKLEFVPADGWSYLHISLPRPGMNVAVEAIDDGSNWGEWLALATPRVSKKQSALP